MITLNNKHLCENCFSETEIEPCPHCGFNKSTYRRDPIALVVGSVLNQRYMIGGVIGKGGFGITYLAYDLKLDARIAVKEYYPMGVAMRTPGSLQVTVSNEESGESFRTGAEKFYNEAKMVAKFNGNPNIVSVHDFFYENDTVYFVMGYLQGQTLKSYLKKKKITEGQAVNIFRQISNALLASHSMNILHRDISPDNIMLCDDGSVRLLDFGAARQVMAEQSQSLSVILKQGFAPLEQYQKKGKQGPWTDIYALGATIYNALTGDMLSDPMSRLEDDSDYEGNKYGITESLWEIIKKCTMLKITDRYQDIPELKEALQSVGIEPEKFTDVDEEISDFLRGKQLTATGATGTGTPAPNYAPASDPNATVLLSAEQGQASNETVAMSPEEAAAYMPQTAQPAPGVPNGWDTTAGMPNQPVTGGYTGQNINPQMQQAVQPTPQQPYMQQGMPVATPAGGMGNQGHPNMTAQYQQRFNQERQTRRVQRKKGIHPVLLVVIILIGLFIVGRIIYSLYDNYTIEKDWDDFKEAFGVDILKMENISDDSEMPDGVLVKEVIDNSAADKTGIESGDIIIEFDNEEITSKYRLESRVLDKAIGDTVEIMIERKRDGTYQKMKGTITLGGGSSSSKVSDDEEDESETSGTEASDEEDNDHEDSNETENNASGDTAYLGIEGNTVTEDYHNEHGAPYGVYVESADWDTPARSAGIQEGYIIVEFDDNVIDSFEELEELIQSHKPGDKVHITASYKADGESSYTKTLRTYITLGKDE